MSGGDRNVKLSSTNEYTSYEFHRLTCLLIYILNKFDYFIVEHLFISVNKSLRLFIGLGLGLGKE